MATVPVSYRCAACGVVSEGAASFEDPLRSISVPTEQALRDVNAVRGALTGQTRLDPVRDLADSVLSTLAERELRYATCPGCGTRNPVGVEEARREDRRWSWITFGLLLALAAVAFAWPWVSLGFIALDLVLLAVALARAEPSARRWPTVLLRLGVDAAFTVAMVVWPLVAPAPPLITAGRLLVRPSSSQDGRFESAAQTLQLRPRSATDSR